jgi:putative transposase
VVDYEIFSKKNYRWKRTRQSHHQLQDPVKRAIKRADLEMLKLAAEEGEINLKYLDESGFCLRSPVSYSYSPKGEQKRMEQKKIIHGNRISILGLWEPGKGFEYGLTQGGFKSLSYIELMNWIADIAEKDFNETGRVTVVAQDNGSIHKSKVTQSHWKKWEEKGLIMFFLAPYCSEMNPIEGEWHQLKAHEMAGQMFDNAYDLAMAVDACVENRYQAKNLSVSRFTFN